MRGLRKLKWLKIANIQSKIQDEMEIHEMNESMNKPVVSISKISGISVTKNPSTVLYNKIPNVKVQLARKEPETLHTAIERIIEKSLKGGNNEIIN